MFPTCFDAILKSADGRFLETGLAGVSLENRTVDFVNEFVPLCKLGENVQIVRVEEGHEIHLFSGQVYLSSRKLLRIVSVHDRLLPGAARYLWVQVNARATISEAPCDAGSPRGQAPFGHDAGLHYLSARTVRFTAKQPYATGQKLYLTLHQPVELERMELEVFQSILFGSDTKGFHCKVLCVPEPSLTRLKTFLEQKNRLFP